MPWVETTTASPTSTPRPGKFVVASPDAIMNGGQGRPLPPDLLEGGLRPAVRLRLRRHRQRPHRLRGGVGVFWNFTPGGHVVVQGPEPAVPAVDGATTSDRTRRAEALGRPAAAAGRRPHRPGAGSTRSIFDLNFRDSYAHQLQPQRAEAAREELHDRGRLLGLARPRQLIKLNPNQAQPTLGVTNADVNRPFITVSPALRDVGQVRARASSTTTRCSVKFQRRFANGFSFMNSYTLRHRPGLQLRQRRRVHLVNVYDPDYNRGPADYDIKHTLHRQLGLRHSRREEQQGLRRLAGERHPVRAHRPRPDHHPGPGRALHGDQHGTAAVQPSGPPGRQHRQPRPDDRPLVRPGRLPDRPRADGHLRLGRPQHRPRPRATSTST